MKRLMRIVIVNKHQYNTYCTIKQAINIIKRNIKAGYVGYITEPKT